MALDYTDTAQPGRGKTSKHTDVVQVRFAELVPNQRIVEQLQFESNDPAFAGTTTLTEVEGGTRIAMRVDNAREASTREIMKRA